MRQIYKICSSSDWRQAESAGKFSGSDADLRDGFIHLSTASQVAETAAKHFSGQADLVLLSIDVATLGDRLKWEPSRGGALFPHFYGQLDPAAVVRVEPLPLRPDGRHAVSPLED